MDTLVVIASHIRNFMIAARVCRTWLRAVKTAISMYDIRINIYSDDELAKAVRFFEYGIHTLHIQGNISSIPDIPRLKKLIIFSQTRTLDCAPMKHVKWVSLVGSCFQTFDMFPNADYINIHNCNCNGNPIDISVLHPKVLEISNIHKQIINLDKISHRIEKLDIGLIDIDLNWISHIRNICISAEGDVSDLTPFANCEHVDLTWLNTSDDIKKLARVRSLSVCDKHMRDEKYTNITSLHIENARIKFLNQVDPEKLTKLSINNYVRFGSPSHMNMDLDISAFTNLRSLYIYDVGSVDMSALTKLERLTMASCKNKIKMPVSMPNLVSFWIRNCSADLDFSALGNAHSVSINDYVGKIDLSLFRSVRTLDLNYCSNVIGDSVLQELNKVKLNHVAIQDMTAFHMASRVQIIYCPDILSLKGLYCVRNLYVANCDNIRYVPYLRLLCRVRIQYSQITDLSPFVMAKTIYFTDMPIRSLRCMVNVQKACLSGLKNLRDARTMIGVSTLYIDSCPNIKRKNLLKSASEFNMSIWR